MADHQPAPGDVIAGKYVIERQLGGGGMGQVVAARHEQLNRRVAIKFLHAQLLDDRQVVERFLREARAAVALRNEHVVSVIDVGTLEDGAPYMVMEYLEGLDLEQILDRDGPLPVDLAIEYVLQACVALAEAHGVGFVHRDIKPSNLFLATAVDGDPLIKVLDFGIAKAMFDDAAKHLTDTGTALGTPLFMSPEQVRDTKDVDHRTDIWSLGAVLYQLLTGVPAFDAETLPALCARIVTEEPKPLRDYVPDAPAALEAVVARCLEKDREARYSSIAAMTADLGPLAPPRARRLADRVTRVFAQTKALGSLPPVANDPETSEESEASESQGLDSTTSPDLARAATVQSAQPLDQTGKAWQSDSRHERRRRSRVLGGLAVVALGGLGVGLWLGGGSGGAPAQTAPAAPRTTATELTPSARSDGAPTAAPDASESAPTPSSPPASPSASAIPDGVERLGVSAPVAEPAPAPPAPASLPSPSPPSPPSQPLPAPVATPPAPPPGGFDLLDERK